MNVLVIGSGGREHAIAKKLLASPTVAHVYCAPGNPGMCQDGIECVAINEDNHASLISFAKTNEIRWTLVGPEQPLINGIVDDFEAAGLKIFGPNQAASQIEGSKAFAKQIMTQYGIPTADYQVFSDVEEARAYVRNGKFPVVIKADGLAAGKGVIIVQTLEDAYHALDEMLVKQKFGKSSQEVVIEEFLEGEEFSLLSFVKNETFYPMVIAQDHKRAYDKDRGPNTGGMGAYSPVPQISPAIVNQAIMEIVKPTVLGMIDNGTPFTGILYTGLINTSDGPKVIEFNARFGDPETQVILSRLTSDLAKIIDDLFADNIPEITWSDEVAVGVVLAAKGYPERYEKGVLIPEFTGEIETFYAGVAEKDNRLVTNGGRVMLLNATAPDLEQALAKVYQSLDSYQASDLFYRSDIAHRALKYLSDASAFN
ncbi:phosphoribosylamine--glycine ligase [Vagococcus zengguangii]|uniref:Phosphoribosylamine--glycine ligase n=1 Tax=Vagococcus zengguangii TaxID=2571750 RepID=A0A4D7CXJ2_9ENTE|nr:phosphoribosylamine--glycine ligase [Vagococcus zengguangii]QCI86556.1 phosphoribosylamine--glycine ligase [Vagococcus zengguangii]